MGGLFTLLRATRRLAGLGAGWIILLLVAAGCTASSEPSARSTLTTEVTWVREGDRWCQHFRIGSTGDVKMATCAKQIQGRAVPTFDVYLFGSLSYQQEFPPGQDAYVFQYWYSSGGWTRRLATGEGEVDHCYRANQSAACEWVSPAVLRQLIAQQADAQRRDQLTQQSNAAAKAAQADGQRALAQAKERAIEMGRIWTAPACVHSYNGCF